jgi:hypothetical protein
MTEIPDGLGNEATLEDVILFCNSLRDAVLDQFRQACFLNGEYDHMCLSAYEDAQRYLIDANLIQADDCVRKVPAQEDV